MPYLSEKIKIAGTEFDRRIKLTSEDREEIVKLYSSGLSQRKIAALYKVDRRTISFIVNPSALDENLKRRKERGGTSVYYSKDKHKNYIKQHRRYKQDLKLKGAIE